MKTPSTSWAEIPSLENLAVDWDYEPENALGKRLWARFTSVDLQTSLEVDSIPVKIVTKNLDTNGTLLDISRGGLAAVVDTVLTKGQPVRVGFILSRQKVIARAIIRNVGPWRGKYRIGMEFVDLDEEAAIYITGLFASKIHPL